MEQSGVPPDNPEFQKAYKLINAVRQQTMIAQQKQKAANQARLAAQQNQPTGTQENGTAQPVSAPVSTTSSTNGTATATAGQPSPAIAKDSPVTSEQMALLRLQIQAFKILAKNMPLSQELKAQLAQSQSNARESTAAKQSPAPKAPTPTPQISENASASSSALAEGKGPPKMLTYTDPYKMFKPAIGYSEHSYRVERPQYPSIIPLGLDVPKLLETRENILHNRLASRLAEIKGTHANIAEWNANGLNGTEDEAIKRRLLIEYHKLRLYEKQKLMRRALSREMMNADNLAMTANRSLYRRRKKQSLPEARITEKLEQQQRDARESKEKKKQTDFLASVVSQAEKLRTSAINSHSRYARLGRAVATQHQFLEREEQKRIERTAKQRLQALKANDEETYLKLLGQAKDTRISHLLRQTDGFLQQLADSVKDQQRSAIKRFGGEVPEPEVPSSEDDSEAEEGARRPKVDYYEVAHRISEEVTAQASCLVGGTLKDYQIKGLQWMISLYNNNLNGILADEMGLGKTIQTISLITYLIEKKKEPGPYLVIVPLSTLTNWHSEFDKWAPSVQKIVYKGPPNQRRQHQQQIRWGQFQVLLTTYEFIIKDRPILSKIKWLHMIVDEGHRMKNAGSKLSSTITQYYTTRYRLILTGTPLQNNLPELWALLNFVLPNIFKSVKSFDEWFNTPFANTGGQDKMDLTEEEQLLVIKRLHKVLRPFLLRRLKRDVEADLPDKQERVIKCGFSALQAKLYKQLVTHNRMIISDGKGGKTGMRGLSNMLMQLRKLCNHPFVFEEVEDQVNPLRGTNDLLWRTAGKFELLDRILPKFHATGHRVLMFFQMTQIMNIMEDFLRLRGLKYLRLDGSTKADDRSDLLKLFNAPGSEYFCFLLSTRAGGLGLNLQTADTVVIYDSDWNPHQDLQAQDRAHRIGQKNEVRILRLITSNSVEEKILERANFKLDMDGKVIQAGKFDNKSTNEERDAMLRVMLETADTAETMENEEMDDDDLNLLMMRHEDELGIFQQIDKDREANSPYGPGKKYPRLMSEEELPDIYLQEDNAVEEVVEEITGRGARERTRVKYDDGLTEEQWLEAVDNDDDTIEAAIARKQEKVARRMANKERKLGINDSPAPSRDSSEEPEPEPVPKAKRGRKPKAEKRKHDEVSLNGDDAPPPPKKRGRPSNANKVKETLSPAHRAEIQKIMDDVHDTLMDMKDENGLELSGPFFDLPPRNEYPDYFKLIKNPICLNEIGEKINKKQYQSLKQFRSDIGLMVENCKLYNEPNSLLVRDVLTLEVSLYILHLICLEHH
jgi:ATP-dependent helicase STH1/SNF2